MIKLAPFSITLAFVAGVAAVSARADNAIELCKLLQPAEIAAVRIVPSGKPEAETVKVKKGETGAPTDVVVESCTLLEGSVYDGINVNVMTFKDKVSEKQILSWLDSTKDDPASATKEITIGQAKCGSTRVAAQETKVNGKVVGTVPEQFATSCDRFLGDRNVGIEVVHTAEAKSVKAETVAAILEKIVSRLPAKK